MGSTDNYYVQSKETRTKVVHKNVSYGCKCNKSKISRNRYFLNYQETLNFLHSSKDGKR